MTDSPVRALPRWRLIVGAILLALAIAAGSVITAASVAGGESPVPPLDTVSNKGIGAAPARLARDEQALQRFEHSGATPTGVVSLLAKRGGRAYYRIEMAHGPTCYAAGPAVRGDYTFGKIMCAGDFPSPERPLLDFTVTHGTLRNGTVSDRRVASSEGVVADGVARVGFRNPSGEIVAAAAAKDNVYQGIPPPGTVTELVALASDGKVLYSQALR